MRRQTLKQIFVVPVVLAVLSAAGLVSALLGDHLWDALSWLTLAIPAVVCIYFPFWRPTVKTVATNASDQKRGR